METIKEINLNISQPNNFQLIHAMQGSVNSIKVIAHLYDGNKPYVIPDTVSNYQLLGVLPSGKYLIDDQLSKYDDHSVTFLINQNMMAKAGYVQFSISLVDADDTAIMETFPAKIMVTAIPGQDYEQLDEIPIVTKSLQEVKRNKEKAEEVAEKSENAYQNLISEKGQPNGIASLDEDGKLPLSQLSVLKDTVLTGVPKAPTASAGTNTEQIATTAFVQTSVSERIAASDALIFKGTIGNNGTVTTLPTTYKTGWTYRVVTDGTYAEQACEIGDLIIALVDRNGSENENTDWCVAQTNINGAITGIKNEDAYINCSQSGSVITISHKDTLRSNTSTTAQPSAGGTFTAIKSVNSDAKGHITGVETETVTLPSLDATGLGFVSIEASQELSDAEKQNARDNIGAVNKNGDTMNGDLFISNEHLKIGTENDYLQFEIEGDNLIPARNEQWNNGSSGGVFGIEARGFETKFAKITKDDVIAYNYHINDEGEVDITGEVSLKKLATTAHQSKGTFTGNVDNLYTTKDNGTYWINVANATGTHPPNNGFYALIVESISDNSATQIALVYNGADVPVTMHVRHRTNGAWIPWGSILSTKGGYVDNISTTDIKVINSEQPGVQFHKKDANGNTIRLASLLVTNTGTLGLWDSTNGKYVFSSNSDGSVVRFNGEANGITGTLPVSNGGTGKTTLTSGQVLVGNGTGAVSQRAIDSSSYGGTDNSTSLITSGAVAKGKAKIAAYGSKKSESFSLDQNFKYIAIGKGNGGSSSLKTESVTIYYYDTSWKNISLIGTGMPGISISGNTMTISYNADADSFRQTYYAVIKML